MAKPVVTLRNIKGSALNYTELDENFINLRDSTINFTDGTNTLSMDLNDTVTIAADTEHNLVVVVSEAGNYISIENQLGDYTKEPMGFENRVDSQFSFNSSNRTFSIIPTNTSYRVWTQGIMRIKTGPETRQIPNTSDLYYFYFDGAGDLQYTTTPTFETDCLIASVQWNATTGQYYYLGEERHGITMDWATHEYLNKTQGFKFVSGLLATNYTTAGTGSNNADAQIDIGNGELAQEDITVSVTHSNSPDYSVFQQDLQGPGRFPVMYHSGSTGQWVKDSATDYPVKQGTARIKYNLNTSGTWTTPDAPNNHYVAMWLVATPNLLDGPIIALMGQREDNSISNAQENNTWASLNLTNFPGSETRPLYRLIFKTGTGYANTPKCYLADIVDFRTTDVRGSLGGGVGVSGITALIDDNTPQLGGDLDTNNFQIFNSLGNVVINDALNIGGDTESIVQGGSIQPLILRTNEGSVSGQITIRYGDTDQHLTIAPHGTGYVECTKAVKVGTYTTTERTNNITATNGLVIYNSTTNTFQGYANSSWINLNPISPAFSAYANNTLQTITSGSQQKVLFQTEEFDTNNNFASSRFTPTVAGYYQLNSSVRIDGSTSTGEIMIVIWKNGSEYKRGTNQQGTQIASSFWEMNVSSIVYANGSTDYFEIYVQQTSGSDRTVTAVASPAITYFNGCMIRAA